MPGTTELELRDIHLPDAVSWWPPAPGWWIIASLLLLTLLLGYLARKYYRSKALQRQIVAEIEAIKNDFQSHKNTYTLIQSLSILLRRSCISFYPRHETAGLTGGDWLRYLDDTYPEKSSSTHLPFQQGVGKILASAPYMAEQSSIDIDANALLELCEKWLQAQPIKNQQIKVS